VLEHRDLSVPDAAYPAAEIGFPSSRPRLKESTLRLKEGPPMELLVIIVILILLFGGGFSLYRR
jgi:hypothetical protein